MLDAVEVLDGYIQAHRSDAISAGIEFAWHDDLKLIAKAREELSSGDVDRIKNFMDHDFRITSHRFAGYIEKNSEPSLLLDRVYLAMQEFLISKRQ